VGVLGLGIGTLAAYGQTGDVFRFYEINPAVVRIAEGLGGTFTYLEDCPGRVEVVLGDARISLEKELERGERQQFDLLVLDTFNSDAIPVHLLTREAFEVYLQHLQPDGILALHISNRYLNLRPVAWGLADYFHLAASLIETGGDGERRSPSSWMLATRNTDFLNRPPITSHSTPRQDAPFGTRLWTDDYSNLFQLLY
jgi:spermidine synthase